MICMIYGYGPIACSGEVCVDNTLKNFCLCRNIRKDTVFAVCEYPFLDKHCYTIWQEIYIRAIRANDDFSVQQRISHFQNFFDTEGARKKNTEEKSLRICLN